MATAGISISVKVKYAYNRDFGALNSIRTNLRTFAEQTVADAAKYAAQQAQMLASPPQRVPRVRPSARLDRLKHIVATPGENTLVAHTISEYADTRADGTPASVNLFFEFGTGRAGSSGRGIRSVLPMPPGYQYGSRSGMMPQAFMGPAYLLAKRRVEERMGRAGSVVLHGVG